MDGKYLGLPYLLEDLRLTFFNTLGEVCEGKYMVGRKKTHGLMLQGISYYIIFARYSYVCYVNL